MKTNNWQPERRRLADQVSQQIKSRVLAGTYPAGSRLPSERVLADELGITRLTLREALKVTEEAGFTRTRHGAGTYVRDVWQNATLGILGEILTAQRALGPEDIQGLLEFRMIIASGFAAATVRHHEPQHVAQMLDIVAKERASLHDVEQLIALDWDFHVILVEASGNRIYSLLTQSVKSAYLHLSRIVFEAMEDHTPIVEAHEAIARALQARDVERLRAEIAYFVKCGNVIIKERSA